MMDDDTMYVPGVVPIPNERQVVVAVEGSGALASVSLRVLQAGDAALQAGATELVRIKLGDSRTARQLAEALLDSGDEQDRRR